VPSSISNSDSASRAPELRWRYVWIGVCVFTVAIIWPSEAFWRARGHRPSVVDDPSLWAYHRRQVSDQKTQVVLLGASRMQLGFSTDVYQDRFPEVPIAMLAINGKHPIATLRDLAEDDKFRGKVICAVTAYSFLSTAWDGQQEYVDYFHHSGPNQLLEPALKSWIQARFVAFTPNLSLIRIITKACRDHRLPDPQCLVTKFDRSCLADYSLIDIEEHRKVRVAKVRNGMATPSASFELWSEDATAVGAIVRRISERGGRVVFVRFPTTDEHWEIDEQRYPKRVNWDQLANLTGAETIHFRDVPSLAHFDCPDTSHLDCRDAPKFTAALLDELVERGILSVTKASR